MANVNIELGYKNLAWFTANPTLVLLEGQIVYLLQTGTYKIGDGVTQLSVLSFLGISSETQTLQNVTDLGSTTTNAINTGGITTDYVQLDLTATNTNAVGKLIWNDTDGTLDLGLKGGNVTLQIGQETVARVVNKTGTNITLLESNYQAVRVTGAIGQRPKVDLALANNDLNSATTLGLVTETILNNQEGFINTSGQVREINTTGSLQGETWLDGDLLYLSGTVPGAITNIKPVAPIHTVIIGFVEYVHAIHGKIFVKVNNGYELEELHNVSAIAPNNNEILTYDLATTLWKPKTVITALGYTPYNSTNPSAYISGITSGMVTTALGFTPYNATNPSGYISGITSGMVRTALGFTPANEDNTILYHALKFFTTAATITTSGTTVTTSSAQFTANHVGMKLTILGESRIIASYISSTLITVVSAYSTNYSGVASTDWGVYNKMLFISATGNPSFLYYNSITSVQVTNDNGILAANYQGGNFGFYTGESVFASTYTFKFSSTGSQFGTKDLGYRRNAAGVFEIYDGITATGLLANRRDLLVRNVNASSLITLAGTTTIAPLKLTAGTNLTTPVSGSFEFDGTNLYFTVGGVRKTVTLI